MPFSNNGNNLFYKIFYNYSYLWHVIAHFGKFFLFHTLIYYKSETKFCASICPVAENVQHSSERCRLFYASQINRQREILLFNFICKLICLSNYKFNFLFTCGYSHHPVFVNVTFIRGIIFCDY